MGVPGTRLLAIKKLTDTMPRNAPSHGRACRRSVSCENGPRKLLEPIELHQIKMVVGAMTILEHGDTGLGPGVLALHVVRIRRPVLTLVVVSTHASHVGSGC